jgi:hypothetical protein
MELRDLHRAHIQFMHGYVDALLHVNDALDPLKGESLWPGLLPRILHAFTVHAQFGVNPS